MPYTSIERITLDYLNRIEKKVDEIMRRQDNDKAPRQMLHHAGQSCPLCHSPVKYQPVISPNGNIIIRECRCEVSATELPKGENS